MKVILAIYFVPFVTEYQKFARKKGFTVQSFEKPVVLKVGFHITLLGNVWAWPLEKLLYWTLMQLIQFEPWLSWDHFYECLIETSCFRRLLALRAKILTSGTA